MKTAVARVASIAAVVFSLACGDTTTSRHDGGTWDGGGIGAACATDNECASGRRCVGKICIACQNNGDCQPHFVCMNGDCAASCATRADCPGAEACLNGACGACVSSADCGDPSLVCLGGSCLHCRSGADCPAGLACLSSGCGACTSDGTCDAGSLCIGGVCKPGACRDNSGCPPTQVCHVQTLSCGTCTLDAQCSSGRVCASGICEVGDCHATSDCALGKACVGNVCTGCTSSSQCARASNTAFVCDTGTCAAGNCVTGSDCTGAQAGDACVGHTCSACNTSGDCGFPSSGTVCVSGKCKSGDCATDVACQGGKLCTGNVCTSCTQNSDCGSSSLVCVAGSCVTGQCASNADCGGLICNASHACVNCAATADCTGAGLAGTVCDTGKCLAGVCTAPTEVADCTASGQYDGLACVGNQCVHCTADAQCPASRPLCVSGQCITGNCHTSADCTTGAGAAATLVNPYCDPASHTCSVCTASSECPNGYVCSASAAGQCIQGDCSFDANCAPFGPSYTCVANHCGLTAPTVVATSTLEKQPTTGSQPSVLSGINGLYYSYAPTDGSGQRQVAINGSDLGLRWQNVEATGGGNTFAGVVAPAPGFPGGELFITANNNNNGITYAHEALGGKVMWTVPTSNQATVGIAGAGATARLTLASGWYNPAGPYRLLLVNADGTHFRSVNVPACNGSSAPAFGKSLVYFACFGGLNAIDPISNTVVFTLKYPTTNGNDCNESSPAVWRSGPSATSETVYFSAGVNGCGSTPTQFWVTVTDAQALSGGATSPSGLNAGPLVSSTLGYSNVATFFDTNDLGSGVAPRVLYAGGNPVNITVTDGIGTPLAQVQTPFNGPTSYGQLQGDVALAADGSIVGVGGSNTNPLLIGIRIAPNPAAPAAATVTTLWSLPLTPAGSWQMFSYPTASAAPGPLFGDLLVWGMPGGVANAELMAVKPGPSAASFLPPQGKSATPSWPWYGGDPGAHQSVANFECDSNTDCTAPASCVMNRCIGVCRSGTDCTLQRGCVIGQCQECVADASCAAGSRCSGGMCFPSGACSFDSDCGTSQICTHATCVTATLPLTSITPPGRGVSAVGTDGSLYSLFVPVGGTDIQAWDTTTLGTSLAPLGTWPKMTIAQGPYGLGVPTIVRLSGNAYDTLYVAGYSNSLYAIPGVGAPSAGGANYVVHALRDGLGGGNPQVLGPLAQGTSTVVDGVTPAPTFFSYENNRIYAFDAAAAASGATGPGGAGNLSAVWSAATGCGGSFCDNSGPSPVPLLVGSDGTIYHFRLDGQMQAWDPNGNRSVPATGGAYPGKLLWNYTASPPWSSNVGVHPAIFAASGHDVLYFCTYPTNTISLLNVTASGASGYLQTSVPCSNYSSIVIDPAGYALVTGSSVLTLMTPAGDIASQLTLNNPSYENNVTLGDDGIAYFFANGPLGQEMSAVQITPWHTLVALWQVPTPGNGVFDIYSFLQLVPGTTPGTAHLMADYPAGGGRAWTSYSLGTTVKPMPGAWSIEGGDFQHRNSLKPQ